MKASILAGLLLIAIIIMIPEKTLAASMEAKTRGIKNNNPGNIRRTGDAWQGLADPQTDSAYCQFVAPEYGIRAMAKLLKRYYDTYGLVSVRGIITRWSPETENPTSAYIKYVSNYLKVMPTDALNFKQSIKNLVKAIIAFENGDQPYSEATINKGLDLAGVSYV